MQEFYGWNIKCYHFALFWWQWKHRPTPAEELLIGQVTGSPSLPELAGTYPYILESEYAEYARTNFSDIMAIPPQTQLWSISPETLALISGLSVNFYATSDDDLEYLHLFGLTTTDAEATMVGQVVNGPYAEVFVTNSARARDNP